MRHPAFTTWLAAWYTDHGPAKGPDTGTLAELAVRGDALARGAWSLLVRRFGLEVARGAVQAERRRVAEAGA